MHGIGDRARSYRRATTSGCGTIGTEEDRWPSASAPDWRPTRPSWSMSTGSSAPTTTSGPTRPIRPSGSRSARPGIAGRRFNGAFNEAHIAATTEAICRYREAQGTDGPLFIGRDTHALSLPAFETALAVLAAHGVDIRIDAADGYTPTPGDLARDPRPQPRAPRSAGRRDRRHPVAQPARGRRLQVQPAQRRPRRHRRHGLDPGRGQPPARSRPGRGAPDRPRRRGRVDDALRLRRDLRGRPRDRHRHGRDPLVGAADRGRSARWRERGVLAGDRRALRPRPDRHERHGRPAVRVHDLRLGRADPDGPLIAPRDGPPGRAEGPLRRRARQRHRCRPPRDRHAGRGPPQPEPLPRRSRSATCSAAAATGERRSPSARRSSRAR